jgi:hypothetical protein
MSKTGGHASRQNARIDKKEDIFWKVQLKITHLQILSKSNILVLFTPPSSAVLTKMIYLKKSSANNKPPPIFYLNRTFLSNTVLLSLELGYVNTHVPQCCTKKNFAFHEETRFTTKQSFERQVY